MHRGVPQIASLPEFRQKEWDINNNIEREKYTAAMTEWKKDYPETAELMRNCIGDPNGIKNRE